MQNVCFVLRAHEQAFFYSADAWLNPGAFDIIYIETREKNHGRKVCILLVLFGNSSKQVTDRYFN